LDCPCGASQTSKGEVCASPRSTDVTEKFLVRVDVTEEFPFLVTKLSPYYDR
jgi:hypothetical protein